MKQKWDYYYSRKMEETFKEKAMKKSEEYRDINVCVNNFWHVFTEAIHSGETPVSNYDDLVFLGSTIGFSNNFIGNMKESIRKNH